MIDKFIKAWYDRKDELTEYLKKTVQSEYDEYEKLVKLLFDIVINPAISSSIYQYDTDHITILGDDDDAGTKIFILCKKTHVRSIGDYVYTYAEYGTCSTCDTLMGINEYHVDDPPTDEQVEDYMTLLLHLLQRCAKMGI